MLSIRFSSKAPLALLLVDEEVTALTGNLLGHVVEDVGERRGYLPALRQ